MTFMLWQRAAIGIASPRLVLRAAEVPALGDALALCAWLGRLHDDERAHIERACREAIDAARAQGLEEGRRAARDELCDALRTMTLASERERERLRGEIGALALQVVRKLLGSFADDELLAALAQTAAHDTLAAGELTVVVHPDLCDSVRARLAAGGAADPASAAPNLRVRGDPSCARDACRLETELGSVDASLDAQLARLADAWAAARKESAP